MKGAHPINADKIMAGMSIAVFLSLVGLLLFGFNRLHKDTERPTPKPKYRMGQLVKIRLPGFYRHACPDQARIVTYRVLDNAIVYDLSPIDCKIGFDSKMEFLAVEEANILRVLAD